MNRTALTIAAAVSLSLSAGTLTAGENAKQEGGQGNTSRGMTSQDQYGVMGKEQGSGSMAGQRQTFEVLDSDGNGVLTEEELGAYGSTAAGGQSQDQGKQMMESLDEDRDGVVTQDEMERGQENGIMSDPAPEETGTAK